MMESYITKDGKRLRRGRTTGSCAAAAAKAAAIMLLTAQELGEVYLTTPSGIGLTLTLQEVVREENAVSCGIIKDSGDDPDVTDGITIYAKVEKTDTPRFIEIDGGEGIGRVTKPGLDQSVGSAAINSVPRRMITEALAEVKEDCGYDGGLRVTISAPGGEELAKRTFNPRLGIVGGISILGTTGIVEPMSDEAVIGTIRAELSLRAAQGHRIALFTPGNYGAEFIKNHLKLDPELAVITSNFIGDAFALAEEAGFEYALTVGHIGKLVKLAGGMFNTHSRYGDCRAEIFAAHAGMRGAETELVRRLMDSATTDDMLYILDGAGLREKVAESIMRRLQEQLDRRFHRIITGALSFSKNYGILGMTDHAREILDRLGSPRKR